MQCKIFISIRISVKLYLMIHFCIYFSLIPNFLNLDKKNFDETSSYFTINKQWNIFYTM